MLGDAVGAVPADVVEGAKVVGRVEDEKDGVRGELEGVVGPGVGKSGDMRKEVGRLFRGRGGAFSAKVRSIGVGGGGRWEAGIYLAEDGPLLQCELFRACRVCFHEGCRALRRCSLNFRLFPRGCGSVKGKKAGRQLRPSRQVYP